jgi:ABC-2 type transport system permease protein
MMSRLAAQIVKELLNYLRDPKSRLMLIGPPLIQLFVFSYAATFEVDNVRVAVLNDDVGRASQELISNLDGAPFIDDLVFVDRPQELAAAIDRRDVMIAVRFPADFSRNVAAGRPAVAELILDGRRANAAQIMLRYLNLLAADTGTGFVQQAGRGVSRAEVRHWFNPNVSYVWFVVPSLSGILAMMNALLVTSLSIARERELGTFDQLRVSPATPIEIAVGKTAPALITGSFLASVMILAGVFVFRIPFTGSLFWLLASLIVFIFSMVGIGLMLSSICRTQQQAILGTFSIGVPLTLISGFATPVENMPSWLRGIAAASPLKYYLVIVRGTFMKALPPSDVLANIWPMALIALVTFCCAVLIVKRSLQ